MDVSHSLFAHRTNLKISIKCVVLIKPSQWHFYLDALGNHQRLRNQHSIQSRRANSIIFQTPVFVYGDSKNRNGLRRSDQWPDENSYATRPTRVLRVAHTLFHLGARLPCTHESSIKVNALHPNNFCMSGTIFFRCSTRHCILLSGKNVYFKQRSFVFI